MTNPCGGIGARVLRYLCFVIPSEFDIRISSFGNVHPSNPPRIADFSASNFLPMKTSSVRSASNGASAQRPATKLKSCAPSAKRMKPLARTTLAGRPFTKPSKQSREKNLLEVNEKDSNSG